MEKLASANDRRITAGNVCVLFTAPWCGPCRMVKPRMEKLAAENSEAVLFLSADVDTDAGRAMAIAEGVKAVPTAILYKDGEKIASFHGLGELNESMLQKF